MISGGSYGQAKPLYLFILVCTSHRHFAGSKDAILMLDPYW